MAPGPGWGDLGRVVPGGGSLKGRNERSTMRFVVVWRMEMPLDVRNDVADHGYGLSKKLGGTAKTDRPLLDRVRLGDIDPWHRRSGHRPANQGSAKERHRCSQSDGTLAVAWMKRLRSPLMCAPF